MFKITVILILWGLAVINTELLIRWNRFAASDGSHSQWQFGQVSEVQFTADVCMLTAQPGSAYVPR